MHATCRRVWVCKRCGNCLEHCKHKDESNFQEDLSMPCSARTLSAAVPQDGPELLRCPLKHHVSAGLRVWKDDPKILCLDCGLSISATDFVTMVERWNARPDLDRRSVPAEPQWMKSVPMKDQWFIPGWYWMRRRSNYALTIININQHGRFWQTGSAGAKFITDYHGTGEYEFVGPLSPEAVSSPSSEQLRAVGHKLLRRFMGVYDTGDLDEAIGIMREHLQSGGPAMES